MAMNTKTMRLPPRRLLTQPSGPCTPNNKRKERDDDAFNTPKPFPKLPKPDNTKPRPAGSDPSNQLLAGYLAHEFLTRGTLLGQPWGPVGPARADWPTEKRKGKQIEKGEADPPPPPSPPRKRSEHPPEKLERYVEVAGLLNVSGPQVPGIVNPTQLGRFLHL